MVDSINTAHPVFCTIRLFAQALGGDQLFTLAPFVNQFDRYAMPKNKLGGNKAKRAKGGLDQKKQELIFKEDGQEYGQVLRMLGNGRCECKCFDGTSRLCHIRGKMRKKVSWPQQRTMAPQHQSTKVETEGSKY